MGGLVIVCCFAQGMDSPVGQLNKFVALDETFGYVEDVDTAYQVLREFETLTTTRFCSFYAKDFGKHKDQGKGKSLAGSATFRRFRYV